MSYPMPSQELELARLQDLQELALLDSGSDPAFDDLVKLAAQWCEVPIAAVSLVAADRQWCKARCGLDASEIPREQSLCSHALLQPDKIFAFCAHFREGTAKEMQVRQQCLTQGMEIKT